MTALRFEKSVWLDALPTEVYRFHEDPSNLRKICPKWLKIDRLESAKHAEPGGKFFLLVRQFGIPMQWEGEWEVVEAGKKLVDIARQSPFAFWRHHHEFMPEGDGTRMRDLVEYNLPFGLLGHMAGATIMQGFFQGMFASRHAATKRYFAAIKRKNQTPG